MIKPVTLDRCLLFYEGVFMYTAPGLSYYTVQSNEIQNAFFNWLNIGKKHYITFSHPRTYDIQII